MSKSAAEKYLIAAAQTCPGWRIYPADIEKAADMLGVGREDTVRNLLSSPHWYLHLTVEGPKEVLEEGLKDPARLIAASAGWVEGAATTVRAHFTYMPPVVDESPSGKAAAKLIAEQNEKKPWYRFPWLKEVGKWGVLGYVLTRVWILLSAILKVGAKGKSLLSMLLSVWVYAWFWGLPFAFGFVAVLFIHELGHVYMLRRLGIKAGAPMFIPFVGAAITLKEHPQNVWDEAKVGIGGPLLGTIGALVVLDIGICLESDLWFAVAYVGFMINLFNMLPLHPMDGGRILIAVSRWFLIVGFVGGIVLFFMTYSPILVLILFIGFFGMLDMLKSEKKMTEKDREKRKQYFALSTKKKVGMGVAYVALLMVIVLGMMTAHVDPETLEEVTEGGIEAQVEDE